MTVRWETIQVDGQPARVYTGIPDRPGPVAGVLVAHHLWGVDAQMQDVVHRLYRQGYAAAAPELFHRQSADVDPRQRSSLLLDTEIVVDLKATSAHLKTLAAKVGPLGIVGFCMGGRVSYLAAATLDELKAAAVFYGGNIMIPRGEGPTPFERSAGIQCPIIGFSGSDDVNPSPEDMKKIDAELTRLNKVHEFHLYLNADHGFQNFAGERYRERASRASWTEMLAFFTQHLKRARSDVTR